MGACYSEVPIFHDNVTMTAEILTTESDNEPLQLFTLARTGNRVALGQLLDVYRQYLYFLARVQIDREIQGKIGASDVVQETYLEAHRDFGQFRGGSVAELVGWLRQILARNLSNQIRRYRGTRRRDVRLERGIAAGVEHSSEGLGAYLVAAGKSPSQAATQHEAGVILAEALGRLPADYREVLILRNLEELTFPEVAQRMDRSVDSVRKLWARALARLRGLLPEMT